jgi:hypothetical protein
MQKQSVSDWQRENTMLGKILVYEILLEYEGPECYKLMYVNFIADFGPWPAGTRVDILSIDYETGVMEEYNLKNELQRKTKIGLRSI